MNTKLIIVCLLVSFLINSSIGCQCYAGIGLKCGHQDGMEGNCDPNHIYHCQELGETADDLGLCVNGCVGGSKAYCRK